MKAGDRVVATRNFKSYEGNYKKGDIRIVKRLSQSLTCLFIDGDSFPFSNPDIMRHYICTWELCKPKGERFLI